MIVNLGYIRPLNDDMAQRKDVIIHSTRRENSPLSHALGLHNHTTENICRQQFIGQGRATRLGATAPNGCANRWGHQARRKLSGKGCASSALREPIALVVHLPQYRLYALLC